MYICIGVMLNNKIVLIWCHLLDHNCIFVFQAVFLVVCKSTVSQKDLTIQTLCVLHVN